MAFKLVIVAVAAIAVIDDIADMQAKPSPSPSPSLSQPSPKPSLSLRLPGHAG